MTDFRTKKRKNYLNYIIENNNFTFTNGKNFTNLFTNNPVENLVKHSV